VNFKRIALKIALFQNDWREQFGWYDDEEVEEDEEEYEELEEDE
jgi:hypothetical protein